MKRSSIWLLLAFLVMTLLLVGCTDTPAATDTDTNEVTESDTRPSAIGAETEYETEHETEHETSATTQAETEHETEPWVPGTPTINADFPPAEVYHVEPNQKNGSVQVNVSNVSLQFDFESTFMGSESAINRDTHHFGHLFTVGLLSSSVKGLKDDSGEFRTFVMGNFVGDRMDEFVMIDNGILTIAAMDGNQLVKYVVYTQDLGLEAQLVGTGMFDGDLYTDIALYTADGRMLIGYGSSDGFVWVLMGALPDRENLSEGQVLCTGDVDGNGITDLVLIEDLTVTTYLFNDGAFIPFATSTLPYAQSGQLLQYTVGDFNSDRVADVLCTMVTGTNDYGHEYHAIRTYFGRCDGHFGPYESEGDNRNLYATYENDPANEKIFAYEYITAGDPNGDGVHEFVSIATAYAKARSMRSIYVGDHLGNIALAYDYSSHIIKTDDGYILYNGGLWQTYDTENYNPGECDHILAYTSEDGLIWHQNLDSACIYTAHELGVASNYVWGEKDPETGLWIPGTGDRFTDKWWVLNTIEPEVIRDPETGIYYMYIQTENYCFLEDGVTPMGADRIGVATSTDGIHFERKIDSPAVITSDIYSAFDHQQVIYVPDDPEGKNWWMYVRYVHRTPSEHVAKYVLIRSDDPTCFDADTYQDISGFANWSIGNQTGYISNYDGKGNRLFINIEQTYAVTTDYTGQEVAPSVPTLMISTDGINWVDSGIILAGVDLTYYDEAKRANLCFLGMSTIYGTGEIYKNENGEYEFIYAGCATPSFGAPGIFHSDVGMGIMTFTLDVLS